MKSSAKTVRQFRRSEMADTSQVGDRVVLFRRGLMTAVVLNAVGSWIWELLESAATVPTLASRLRERFPSVSSQQAEMDVATYLGSLATHGMVVAHE